MSRAPHSRHAKPGSVPVVADTADATTTVPAVPSTEPLPSDQLSAPREPVTGVVGDAPIVPEPAAETAPLPAPTPAASDEVVDHRATRLAHVDGTVPLPSDQITPLVHVEQANEPNAGRDKHVSLQLSADISEDVRKLRHRVDLLHAASASPARKASFLIGITMNAAQALRRELEDAGYGVVILSASTVELLRDDFGLSPISGGELEKPELQSVDDVERRRFRVMQDVSIDGRDVAPGDYVRVTRDQFDRLHQSGTIRTAFWSQGLGDGEDDLCSSDDGAEDD